MTEIDTASGLAAAIRRQVASFARPSGSGALSSKPHRDGSAPAELNASVDAPPDIATLVARRVQAIDPDDPNRSRKAFRIFLESVLLAEFGDALINDAGFHQLVEEVHLQMETDEELAPAIRTATSRMLSPSLRTARR